MVSRCSSELPGLVPGVVDATKGFCGASVLRLVLLRLLDLVVNS